MKIIYIQDDCTVGTAIQFCLSKDMEMLDRWVESLYGSCAEVFHDRWETYGKGLTGIRNLKISAIPLPDFISMCETLGYTVKRVKNELYKGDSFMASCIEMYPEDFQ